MERDRMKRLFGKILTIPEETLIHSPKITIINQTSCHIENHQGIQAFSDSKIILKTPTGLMVITGSSLVISMMLKDELFLEGQVDQVTFTQ